jgi:hypothetical protein
VSQNHERDGSGKAKRAKEGPQVVGFLGVGLDNEDDHRRLTRTEYFMLLGGSQETHERMQDTAIRFTEGLERSGRRLEEASLEQILELFHRARE